MEELLREIKIVPGVMGSYIHVNGVSTVTSDLPKIFLNKINEIGEAIDRVVKVNEVTKMHAANIEFKYNEAVIIVRPIDADSSLITFCETDINKKTLNMTTGMLTNELKQAVVKIRKGGAGKAMAPPAAAPRPPASPPRSPQKRRKLMSTRSSMPARWPKCFRTSRMPWPWQSARSVKWS